VYVHLSGRDLDEKLIALYSGKPVEPVKPSFSPVICPRCTEQASPGMLYCPKCATPLDPRERSKVALEDQTLRNELTLVRKMVEKYLPQASAEAQGSAPVRPS
jgi:integrase/recombinase XerD